MKTILTIAFAIISSNALADSYVSPHVRHDGTYVEGYYRSSPDSNPYNNYSSSGNTNPYTGERGSHNPSSYEYSTPSYGTSGGYGDSGGYGGHGRHRYGDDN